MLGLPEATQVTSQSGLQHLLSRFESDFGVPILQATLLLTRRQVLWCMKHLGTMWLECNPCRGDGKLQQRLAHLLAWFGWLRSLELFSLSWGDTKITRPENGPVEGLAQGNDIIELRLRPETKSNRTKVADIVIAYACASGLIPGLWVARLQHLRPDACADPPIIWVNSGAPWTGLYFRSNHLYVCWLHQMRAAGDPFPQAFAETTCNRIEG